LSEDLVEQGLASALGAPAMSGVARRVTGTVTAYGR
jgi:hypothetical protein